MAIDDNTTNANPMHQPPHPPTMPHPSPIPPPSTAAATRPAPSSLLHPKPTHHKPNPSRSYDPHSSDSSGTSGSDSEEEYRAPVTDECLRAEYLIPGLMDSLTSYCTSRGGPRAPAAKVREGMRGEARGHRHRRVAGSAVDRHGGGGELGRAAGGDEDGVGGEWGEDEEHLAFLRQQAGMEGDMGRVVELVPRAGEADGQRVAKRRRDADERGDAGEGERHGKRPRSGGEAQGGVDDDELSYSSFLLAASTSFLVEPVEAAPLPDLSVADTGRLQHLHSHQDLGAPWMIIDSLPVSVVSGNLNPCPICLAPLSHPPFDYSTNASHGRRRRTAPFNAADSSDSDNDDDGPTIATPQIATTTAECITLPCMHLIHAPCARQSLVANRKCPECRCDVVEAVRQAGGGGRGY